LVSVSRWRSVFRPTNQRGTTGQRPPPPPPPPPPPEKPPPKDPPLKLPPLLELHELEDVVVVELDVTADDSPPMAFANDATEKALVVTNHSGCCPVASNRTASSRAHSRSIPHSTANGSSFS